MPEIMVDASKMEETAEIFGKACDQLSAISKDLDDSIKDLEGNWAGVSKQQFYKHFLELKNYLDSFADLSSNISKEMYSIAENINKIDAENFQLD